MLPGLEQELSSDADGKTMAKPVARIGDKRPAMLFEKPPRRRKEVGAKSTMQGYQQIGVWKCQRLGSMKPAVSRRR